MKLSPTQDLTVWDIKPDAFEVKNQEHNFQREPDNF